MREALNRKMRKEVAQKVQQKGATCARAGFALDSGDAAAGL